MNFIKSLFTQHKKKMFLCSLITLIFTFILFPFGDLSDKITAVIAQQTNNTVYVQFDDMSLTMMPMPGVKMMNVVAEFPSVPELAMSELSVAPSLGAIFKQKPFGHASAEDLFSGVLDMSVSGGSKGSDSIAANVSFSDFNLREVLRAQPGLPFTASGIGQLQANLDFDPNMKTQPDGEIQLSLRQTQIPSFNIPLGAMGILPMPGLNWDKVMLKGKMKNGKLTLTDTVLGSPKDELYGKISGNVDLNMGPGGSRVDVSAYNLAIDITLSEGLLNQLNAYMTLVDGMVGKYKSTGLTGTRYAFRIQGRSMGDFPNITEL